MNVGLLRKKGGSTPSPRPAPTPEDSVVRCAVYTRKSTEEGLEQEFNTLHAQREACENYIKSQTSQGWQAIPTLYDDGGFTGGNTERPALKLLLTDIQAGKVDCVLVYKVDRLSRSLVDFSKLMEVFQQHSVSFVSVTQQFSTATSGGRLFLNMLLSFAQYERELISERTRDKVHLARKRGKWTGGRPVLGYDLQDGKLVPNPAEAQQVQELFTLYLHHGSLLRVAQLTTKRGWSNKSWVKQNGDLVVGNHLDKTTLHRLLTNPLYLGKVQCDGELYPGEHSALVTEATFQQVQELLESNSPQHTRPKAPSSALLRGLLRCGSCQTALIPSTSRRGTKVYRYYTCTHAQKNGQAACPQPYWPALPVEEIVLDEVRDRLGGPDLLQAVLTELDHQHREAKRRLSRDRQKLQQDQSLLEATPPTPQSSTRLTQIRARLRDLDQQAHHLHAADLSPSRVATELTDFPTLWQALRPAEHQRLLGLLIDTVTLDGPSGEVLIAFKPDHHSIPIPIPNPGGTP